MNTSKKDNSWNPYLAGTLSGLLIILSVAVSGNYFGTSTSFIQVTGMLEKMLAPQWFTQTEYFNLVKPVLSWQILFVVGIFIGSFIAAIISGDFKWQFCPDFWKRHLGTSFIKRGLIAFVGGIIAMIGARIAGGCPSGQMSSLILLSINGLAAMTMFFSVGIITIRLLYKGGEQ